MNRIRLLIALVGLALLLPLAAASAAPFPERIDLPDGWRPEGIAIAPGGTFYVGSIPTGAVYSGDLRTGEGSVLVPAQAGRAAIGVEFDQRLGRLFVAGGATGQGYVYDAETGANLASFTFAAPPTTFVNDVVVTKDAAWFTDTRRPFLYRVPIGNNGELGTPEAIPLSGDIGLPGTGVNGIDATPNGETIIIVQSSPGRLFTVDESGLTIEIDLGGALVSAGDGLLLDGKTLYVVRNVLNQVAVVNLDSHFTAGTIVGTLTHPDFSVPTTTDEFGNRLYLVNARFGVVPTPDTDYWITQLRKHHEQ